MLASAAVFLPLGVSAVEDAAMAQTIYSEDFEGKDGVYTASGVCDVLGWELLRGDANAQVATIADGVLTLTASDRDLVYKIKSAFALVNGCTVQYDLTQLSYTGGKTMFSTVYVGNYDVATGKTRAVVSKCNNEGYHHMSLVDGDLNEKDHTAAAYLIPGTGHEQARGENILWGEGYSKPTSTTTWKHVYDTENNQVDTYASNVRVNSTVGNVAFENYNIADYMGKNAYLVVQAGRASAFDNIVITEGGEAITHDSNVVFEQNFDDITYDPETETPQQLAEKIGFQSLPVTDQPGTDPTEKNPDGTDMVIGTQYGIVDGTLDILSPYNAGVVEPRIYIPEMEKAKEVVIEFDQQYVYKDIPGEYDRGDQSVEFQMYGRRSDVRMWFRYTQKGFATMKCYWDGGSATVGQIRPQTINYNNRVSGHKYTDWTDSHYNVYQSRDRSKIVMNVDGGVEWYINGALTMYFNDSQLESWKHHGEQIMGSILKYYIPAGCHVQYDKIKVTVDPDEEPELLITEAASTAFGNDAFEYVEVYNNASKAVNIYDYVLINQTIADSMKHAQNTAPANIVTMYPGAHTYKSVATDKKSGDPLYSLTLTNPDYAGGWLQPGEVALIWNTADAMHSGTAQKPVANEKAWNYTVADFRKELAVSDSVKVFMAYNDYNTTLENSGRYLLALADRSIYQPKYQAAYTRGDEVLAEIVNSYDNFTSYVYMLLDGPFDPGDNRSDFGDNMNNNDEGAAAYPTNSGHCYRPFMSDLLSEKTGGPEPLLAAQFQYANNNRGREGRCIDYANVETRFDVSPGVVSNRQKRTVAYQVDDYTKVEKYLGTTVHYEVADTGNAETRDGKKTLFSFNNGTISFGELTTNLCVDTKIDRVGAHIFTLNGAALTFDNNGPVMTWTTAIKRSDFEDILKYAGYGVIREIEVGTLIAKTADLANTALTVENAGVNGVVTKVGAKTENWFNGANVFRNEYYLIKASQEIATEDYGTEYSAVGYITVTMLDGRTLTIYGGYSEDAHARSATEIAAAVQAGNYEGYTNYRDQIDAILPPAAGQN